MSIALPIQAQDGSFATNTPVGSVNTSEDEDAEPPIFTTNTPVGSSAMSDEVTETTPLIFATNTPIGAMPDASSEIMTQTGPQDLLFNYGMRVWFEADFVDLVFEQIQKLDAENEDTELAINLLLYELENRFPSAPIIQNSAYNSSLQ